jgi:parallel beta-helix repeat protein
VVSDSWTKTGTVWSRPWSTPQFCGGKYQIAVGGVSPVSPNLTQDSPCSYADSIGDPAHPVAGDPQLAFANGAELTQMGTLAAVTPGSYTFFYDWSARRIYVSENPTTSTIELATRPAAMILGGPYNFTLRGIGFRHYASSILGNAVVYAGLGGAGSPGKGTFENLVFRQNAGVTLSISGPKNGTAVRSSVFAYNDYIGLHSNGFASSNPGVTNGLLVEGNVFNGNNAGMADTDCSASCGAANVKLAHMTGFTVRGNVFENAVGSAPGFWCDLDCSGGVIVDNSSHDNGGHGIFYEVSNTGIIANNIVADNGGSGIAVASANTKIYNNTIVNRSGPNVQAVWIYDDRRPAPTNQAWPYVNPAVDLGPNTTNVEFANNLVVAQQPAGARLLNFANATRLVSPDTTSGQYFSVLDDNLYYLLPGQNLYSWATTDGIDTPAALRTVSGQAWEKSSLMVTGTSDPFVNRTQGDYTDAPGSLPTTAIGRALPADVAAAIGVSGPVGRGVIG